MPEVITPSGLQLATECKAKAMITDLGTSYRAGQALTTVSNFQDSWNLLLPYVKTISGVLLPSKNGGLLKPDGLYGEQTATAAQNFLQAPKLPTRAADMPVWMAKNNSAVSAMCPPQSSPDPLPPPVALPPTINPAQPPNIPVIENTPLELTPQPVTAVVPAPAPVVIQQPSAPSLIPEPIAIPGETIIRTSPERGDTPWLAIGIGAAVVGGVLTAWLYKRR